MSKSAGPSERPLSPHLQVYRWPITMASSIAHRTSGIVNSLGIMLITAWLFALSTGPGAYDAVNAVVSHWIGQIILFGFTVSISYHLLNGIRHLYWDAGKGFALGTARATAWLVFIAGFVLAAAIWAVGFWQRGII